MQPAKINYKIYQGSTFEQIYRWESETKVYVPISEISKDAPCVLTTSQQHELPLGWRFRVTGVSGMKEINSAADSYYTATGVTSNTVTINQINSTQYTQYISGGILEYNLPVPLTTYSARMQIRETVESPTVIYSATSNSGTSIIVDNINKTILISIPASVTKNFSFSNAVYSVELYESEDSVIPFLLGNLTLVPEVTR